MRQQQLVLAREPQRRAAAVADVGRRFEVEPVWREPLHPERDPVAPRPSGARIVAKAELGIPERVDRVAPQQFGSGVFDTAFVNVPLGLEDQLVVARAEPGLGVIRRRVRAVAVRPLQAIHQHGSERVFVRHHEVACLAQRVLAHAEAVSIRVGMRVAGVGRGRAALHAHAAMVHLHGAMVHARHCTVLARRRDRGRAGCAAPSPVAINGISCAEAMPMPAAASTAASRALACRLMSGVMTDVVSAAGITRPPPRGTCPRPCAASGGNAMPSGPAHPP
ncbi:hypothetical protein ACEQUB_p00472 (plasmid) [Ralstonia syzygii]